MYTIYKTNRKYKKMQDTVQEKTFYDKKIFFEIRLSKYQGIDDAYICIFRSSIKSCHQNKFNILTSDPKNSARHYKNTEAQPVNDPFLIKNVAVKTKKENRVHTHKWMTA